jgi:hypothetical protein
MDPHDLFLWWLFEAVPALNAAYDDLARTQMAQRRRVSLFRVMHSTPSAYVDIEALRENNSNPVHPSESRACHLPSPSEMYVFDAFRLKVVLFASKLLAFGKYETPDIVVVRGRDDDR